MEVADLKEVIDIDLKESVYRLKQVARVNGSTEKW
jgi:hypothetical protein